MDDLLVGQKILFRKSSSDDFAHEGIIVRTYVSDNYVSESYAFKVVILKKDGRIEIASGADIQIQSTSSIQTVKREQLLDLEK